MLFFVLQRGFYSYCKNEVFYDCTLCKQILLLLYTKLLLSGIHADRSIVFCKGNVEKEGNIEYFPWYMVMFYQREREPEGFIYKVDLSGL